MGCHSPKMVRRMSREGVVWHRVSELKWGEEDIIMGKGAAELEN